MGAEVHCESYLRGCCSMRDVNDDSSSSSWSRFYGDKSAPFLKYNNGHLQGTGDCYPEHERDALKQKMLEHEAVFKNQVFELHRLYQIQRNMMEEAKMRDFCSFRPAMEQSSSSCPQGPQLQSDVAKWNAAAFPLWEKQSAPSAAEIVNSSVSLHSRPNPKEDAPTFNGRPSKVRRTFDLHLPADDYLDTEEGEDVKENSVPENVPKKFLVDHLGSSRDASQSSLCLRSSTKLVDLNEPARNEGTSTPSVHVLDFTSENKTDGKSLNQQAKSKADGFGVSGESAHLRNGFFISPSTDGKLHNTPQLSHPYEPGFSRGVVDSLPQSNQQDRPPFYSHFHHGTPAHAHMPSVHSISYGKEEDMWRGGIRHAFESSSRNHDSSGSFNGYLASEGSHSASAFPFLSSFSSAQAPTMLSWAKPSNGFGRHNISNPVSEPLPQSQDQFSRKMFAISSSRMNPALPSEFTSNGFYHGSSSGSKDQRINVQPHGFSFPHFSRFNSVASECLKPSYYLEGKSPAMPIDLNEEVARSPSDEVVILEDRNVAVNKCERVRHTPALPWLKPKPIWVSEAASPSNLWGKNETNGIANPTFTISASNSKTGQENEIAEIKPVEKIMGFPIFDRHPQEYELSSVASTSASFEGKGASCLKKRMIDINVACDPDEMNAEEQPVREFIDLNASAEYCEHLPAQDDQRICSGTRRTRLEIDLEAPCLLECEEDDQLFKESEQVHISVGNDDVQDEVFRKAVELLLEISSSVRLPTLNEDAFSASQVSLTESLILFADAVNALEMGEGNTTSKGQEMDEFEAMTLQLEETAEEQYLLKPFPLQVQNMEDTAPANGSAGRPRRGQARRGRPRRDFQRDILPGLTSLSRHEMTEDLQIFGSLMRGMGHCWSPGLARRNGGRSNSGRGRKRAVIDSSPPCTIIPAPPPPTQKLTFIEPGSEDTSLTGWGKTTRRPRRQRCLQEE